MFSAFAARVASRSVLRLSSTTSGLLLRPAVLSRASLSSPARTFLTTIRVESPAATKKTPAKASATKKPVKKPVKKPAKKPVKKAKKVVKKPAAKRVAKPVKRTYDRALMKPPKRPKTGYMLFVVENKSDSVHDLAASREHIKEVAGKWRELSDSEKQAYENRYQEALIQYRQEYQNWFKSLPPGYMKEINRRRMAKGRSRLRRPSLDAKRPKSAWIYFLSDYRQTHKDIQHARLTDFAKNASTEWKGLSDQEKERFHKLAREEREEWVKARSE